MIATFNEAGTVRGFIADIGLHASEEVHLLASGASNGSSRSEGNQALGTDNRVSNQPLPAVVPLLGAGRTTLGTSASIVVGGIGLATARWLRGGL